MDEIPKDSERISAAAAAAQARREARMKRILENSKSRLSKITGREENASGKERKSWLVYLPVIQNIL